jgi:hypothetical protein
MGTYALSKFRRLCLKKRPQSENLRTKYQLDRFLTVSGYRK